MKKVFYSLLVLLLPLCAVAEINPELLVGKWAAKNVPVDAGDPNAKMSVNEEFTFVADGTVSTKQSMTMSMRLDDNVYVDTFMSFAANGDYTVAGDSITVKYDMGSVKVNISEDDIRVRGIDDPDVTKQIEREFFGMFQQVAQGMKDSMNEPMVLNGVVVDEKKMKCVDDGTEIYFSRKKK